MLFEFAKALSDWIREKPRGGAFLEKNSET